MDVLALDRRWRWVFAGCLLALVSAGDNGQVARAQQAAGTDADVLPVTVLVGQVYSQFAGRILRLELVAPEDGSATTYDVKFLGAGGDVMILSYDARTLELLALSGRTVPADRLQAGTAAIEMLQNRMGDAHGDDGDDDERDGDDDERDGDDDGRDSGSDDDDGRDSSSDDDLSDESDDGHDDRDNSGPGGGSDDSSSNSGPGGGDD